MSYIIYKHTFPNGKVYIGITKHKNPNDRWLDGFGYQDNTRMFKDIVKYGWQHIEHRIMCHIEDRTDALAHEALLIKLHRSDLPQYGYNRSAQSGGYKYEVSIDNTTQKDNAHYVPIEQYDKDGNFIKEWSSIKQASCETGIDNSTIVQVCKGYSKRKSAGGYIWKYKKELSN